MERDGHTTSHSEASPDAVRALYEAACQLIEAYERGKLKPHTPEGLGAIRRLEGAVCAMDD